MNATALRERITKSLLHEIDEVQFPSVTMMDRAEGALASQDDLATYVEGLVKKVEGTRYPSISVLNRLDGLLGQLEEIERRQEQERRSYDGDDRS
jgi:hypothetical protein